MKIRPLVLIAFILSMVPTVRANVRPSGPLFLDRDVTVGGAAVPRGIYNLTLETKGSSVRASLWKDGAFVATAHGTWVKHGIKYGENAVLLRVNPDGTRSLTEIRLAGSAKTIVIDDGNSILRIAPDTKAG